jgi:putative DNA primase/helicase
VPDFNDLHVAQGLGAVRDPVMACIVPAHAGGPAENDSPAPPDEGPPFDSEAPPPEGTDTPPAPSGHGGALARGMRVPDLDDLIQGFSLIYGTDTVFDCRERIVMKVSHLTQLVGRDAMKLWQTSPRRRVVRKVVFDPMGTYDPQIHDNLFERLPFDEDESVPLVDLERAVKPIMNHIWWMSSGDDEVYRWLIKWIAYPLQNPGGKMQTSVINYGNEGTGKSFLWEGVIKAIYGRYGITVGQAQLESQFNTWRSQKLFVVAEEVISRAEKAHYKGQLKHMITGQKHMINEKNLPEREEDNLMNFVFLSNNTQPLELDRDDRRYLALYMGAVKPAEYYEQLGEWLDAGGAELFYQYLRRLPLGDFGPHAKPPMTEAKDGLIGLSMTSPQYFFREWSRGELGLPFSPCVNEDLYALYKRWCERSGEYCFAQRKFSGELKRFMSQVSTKVVWPEAGGPEVPKRVWVPFDWLPREGREKLAEYGGQSRLFRLEMLRYLEGKI